MTFYIIIRGPLGIGKTTISKILAKKLKAEHISMDKVLEENNLDKVDEKEGCIPARNFIKADEIVFPKLKSLLDKGKIVIFDGCFYHKEQIEHIERNFQGEHFIFNLKAPLEVCIKRDKGRDKVYGEFAAKIVHKLVSRFDYGANINTEGKTPAQVAKEIIGYTKSIKRKYKFRKYDPIYPKLYKKEEAKIRKLLPGAVIEHVGSTSIPGLGGKGIIDIAIRTPKQKLKRYMSSLKKLGFEYRPHPGDDRNKFMHRVIKEGDKERRVHVHLSLTQEFFDSFISFRDYLRKNETARDEYANVKKEGVKLAKGDSKKYANHKQEVIVRLAAKAREEYKRKIKIETKLNKNLSKSDKTIINNARVAEWGEENRKDFKKDYEPNTLWFFVKDNGKIVSLGGLRPIHINYLGKYYNILGICCINSIVKGKGYGSILIKGMIDYSKKTGKTLLGFTVATEFFRKAGLGTEKDFVKRFVYKNPKTGKEIIDNEGDGIYYEGNDNFIKKVLSTKDIVYIDILHW
jgi:GrpB-like predicted nucleotidyltransferase (UPF0157 family)/shikimate kinase